MCKRSKILSLDTLTDIPNSKLMNMLQFLISDGYTVMTTHCSSITMKD